MMLQWIEMGVDIELQENKVNVIVLERQDMFSQILEDFMISIENAEERFVLYESGKKLNISKSVELIFSPLLSRFAISTVCFSPIPYEIIQTYLYRELKSLSDDTSIELREKVNSIIIDYLDNLSHNFFYPLSYSLNFDETALFKQYDIGIKYETESLLEKMIGYIQISADICHTKIFVLINAKAYFSLEELRELHKIAFYKKIHLIMIENRKYNCLSEEKYYIIDEDKCLIIQE